MPSLPERPAEHQLAAEAELKLRSVLPYDWTLQKIEDDYGIDFLLEVFEDGQTTGRILLIQLKGISQVRTDSPSVSVRLKSSTLQYFTQLPLPCILVVWDARNERLLWSHVQDQILEQVKSDGPEWFNAKTRVVRMKGEDRITGQEDFRKVAARLPFPGSRYQSEIQALISQRQRTVTAQLVRLLSQNAAPLSLKEASEQLRKNGVANCSVEEIAMTVETYGCALLRCTGGSLSLCPMNVAGLVAGIDCLGDQALELPGLKESGGFDSYYMGNIVAINVVTGRLTYRFMNRLRILNPRLFMESVRAMMILAPSNCQQLEGVRVDTRVGPNDEGRFVSHHEVRFVDPAIAALLEGVDRTADAWFEFVGTDEFGYLVEMEALERPSSEGAALITNEARDEKGGMRFTLVQRTQAKRVRAIRVAHVLRKDQVLWKVWMPASEPTRPEITIGKKKFAIVGGPPGYGNSLSGQIRPDGKGERMIIDGYVLLETHFGIDLDDSHMPPEVREFLLVNDQDPASLKILFLYPSLIRKPLPDPVLTVLRGRYEEVIVEPILQD
ncbi:MAG: DUF4365 domain-containing protein [Euryarchaeota archaeon]|nr:DUF4365 domain-containing protein [Euryarchaeota archaeon]